MTISSIRLRNSRGNLISGSEKRFMTALRVPGEISPSTLFKMSAPTLEVMIITQFLRYSTWSQRGFHRKDKKSRLRPNDSPEIHEPSLPVSQATLIQHLKEQGQEFGTCLFDSRNIIKREEGRERGLSGYRSVDDKTAPEGTQLVEKDNTERSSSDVFRELSALIVSHISRRRADLEKSNKCGVSLRAVCRRREGCL